MALKAAIDRIDAVIAIIVLTPLLLAVAAVMRLTGTTQGKQWEEQE